jgi:hypothetical protein
MPCKPEIKIKGYLLQGADDKKGSHRTGYMGYGKNRHGTYTFRSAS